MRPTTTTTTTSHALLCSRLLLFTSPSFSHTPFHSFYFSFHFHAPFLPELLPRNFFKVCIQVAVPHLGKECFYNYNLVFSETCPFQLSDTCLSLTGLITTNKHGPSLLFPICVFSKEFWPPCFLFFAVFRSWSMAGAACHCG